MKNIRRPADPAKILWPCQSIGQHHGTQKAILTEVPLFQPISLAQYTHANFGVRDQQPLFSIGNSFASPLVDAKKAFQDNGKSWTDFDQSYLLNTALWDGFFLSSAAPQMKTDVTTDAAGSAPNPPDLASTVTVTTDQSSAASPGRMVWA